MLHYKSFRLFLCDIQLQFYFFVSFVSQTNQQTDVTLVKRFNQWQYNWQDSLEKRMPWLGARQSLLTTSTHSDYSDWGSIISEKKLNNPAPWIYGVMANPGVIWYWVNEDDCDQNRKAGEWTAWGCECTTVGDNCRLQTRRLVSIYRVTITIIESNQSAIQAVTRNAIQAKGRASVQTAFVAHRMYYTHGTN